MLRILWHRLEPIQQSFNDGRKEAVKIYAESSNQDFILHVCLARTPPRTARSKWTSANSDVIFRQK